MYPSNTGSSTPGTEAAISATPKPYITPEQYLERERQAETKSEYFAGEIFAMPGGSPEHSLISGNALGALWSQLRESPCTPYNSDLKVRATEELYTYPDVTVVCGEAQFAGEEREVLLNPTLIIEVLSPTTEAWDRGGKFEQYRQRESLQEYVLIAQDRPHVERFARQANGQWLLTDVNGLEAILTLPSIGGELALAEVYRKVAFPGKPGLEDGRSSQAGVKQSCEGTGRCQPAKPFSFQRIAVLFAFSGSNGGINRMQRKSLWLIAGVLAVAASASRSAHAAPPAVPGAPAGWVHEDIGGPAAAGDSKVSGTGAAAVWTVTGSGSDIQNAADLFQYAYTNLTGDGGITARILSQTPGDPTWTKTGVMLRESDAPGARMITLNFTSNSGMEPGDRLDNDVTWTSPALPPGSNGIGRRTLAAGPLWLRAQHKGTDFQVLSSNDGVGWHLWGETSIAMDLTKPILAGLCVTAHMDGSLADATFDNVSVDNNFIQILPGIQVSPAPGAVLVSYGEAPGAVGYNLYRRAATDTPDKAVLVNSTPNPYTWFIDDNGGKGLANGTTLIYQVKAVVMDASGKMVEGPASEEASATPQVPINGNFVSYDIGTDYPGSVTVDSNNVITIKGSGQDLFDTTDQGTNLVAPVIGNYMITAKLLADPTGGDQIGSPGYGKVGVIIREGLELGSRYGFAFASVMRDPGEVLFEGREDSAEGVNFSGGSLAFASAKFPMWLRLTRTGATLDGFMSTDGTTFTEIDMPHNYDYLRPVTYAGIAASAHQDGTYVTGMVDGNSLKITPLP